jgi:hypothetical protein
VIHWSQFWLSALVMSSLRSVICPNNISCPWHQQKNYYVGTACQWGSMGCQLLSSLINFVNFIIATFPICHCFWSWWRHWVLFSFLLLYNIEVNAENLLHLAWNFSVFTRKSTASRKSFGSRSVFRGQFLCWHTNWYAANHSMGCSR